HRVVGGGVDVFEEGVQRDARPGGAEFGPLRDAMDVDGDLLARQLLEIAPGPGVLLAHLGGDRERPAVERDAGSGAGGEHREVVREVLARWQPVVGSAPPAGEARRNDAHDSCSYHAGLTSSEVEPGG